MTELNKIKSQLFAIPRIKESIRKGYIFISHETRLSTSVSRVDSTTVDSSLSASAVSRAARDETTDYGNEK